MAVPYVFKTQAGPLLLSQLDANFAATSSADGVQYTPSGTGAVATTVQSYLNLLQSSGAQVTAANTITPTGAIFHVTGATVIKIINLPYVGFTGFITLIPDSAFTTDATGNIALASTGVINKAMTMTYDGTKWYPSY